MDLAALVRSRLTALGLGQKDLARAVQVTDSYISQLLTRKKAPPARDRTDIYAKMEAFLRLEPGELGVLAENERMEEIKRRLGQTPEPLFQEFRELILRKCDPRERDEVQAVFERQPFGTLERLVTQTLLEVVQRLARQELDTESWVRLTARVGGRSHEEMRVTVLEFLDTDIFEVSKENCTVFIDPLVESWDVDLASFRLDIWLNPDLVTNPHRVFRFGESTAADSGEEPGFTAFLEDPLLSGDMTKEEASLLRRHRLPGKFPNKLYYYRALQNLRDPLHFPHE